MKELLGGHHIALQQLHKTCAHEYENDGDFFLPAKPGRRSARVTPNTNNAMDSHDHSAMCRNGTVHQY